MESAMKNGTAIVTLEIDETVGGDGWAPLLQIERAKDGSYKLIATSYHSDISEDRGREVITDSVWHPGDFGDLVYTPARDKIELIAERLAACIDDIAVGDDNDDFQDIYDIAVDNFLAGIELSDWVEDADIESPQHILDDDDGSALAECSDADLEKIARQYIEDREGTIVGGFDALMKVLRGHREYIKANTDAVA